MKQRIRKMTVTALGAVVLTLCGWLTVPFTVPFTMQIFGVFLLIYLLGEKYALISTVLYIALGVIGIPVFSGFGAGIGHLLSPTGGFILGMAALEGVYMALKSFFKNSKETVPCIELFSLTACYAFGMGWYLIYSASAGTNVGLLSGFLLCVVPYIIPDITKIFLARIVAKKILSAYSIKF